MKITENIKKIYKFIEDKFIKIYSFSENKIKYFINKDNFTKTKLLIVLVISCILSVLCEYTIFRISHPEYILYLKYQKCMNLFIKIGTKLLVPFCCL